MIITKADSTLADLSILHVGDTIAYEIVNNQLMKLTIKKQADFGTTIEGTFNELGSDKTFLTINKKADNSLGAYPIADNVKVQIDGLSNAGVLDLQKGDTVKLELLNNKAVKITVTNRVVSTNYFSKIVSYKDNVLTVLDNNGEANAYNLTDSTALTYLGMPVTLDKFSQYFIIDKRINLKVSNKKVISIDYSSQTEGTVSQLNVTNNDLTIKTSSGQLLSFKLFPGQQVSIPNKTNTTSADLLLGDSVTVTISPDQSFVTNLAVNKSFVYKIALANNASKQVILTDEANASYTYSLDGIPLIKPDQSTALYRLVVDDYLKLSFKGTSIVKGEIISSVTGKITALDANTSSVTVQDSSGNSKLVAFGANYAIKQNGGELPHFLFIKSRRSFASYKRC